ncbi:MAG: hypothetical protein KTR18_14190 [Acidiferrobacterales bacterium]|nr:hypothetical protein [Acidiferrobacterales bacterium]
MSKIKVLNISALSYSGTTWLNLLLGSHDDVFALGPPHRVWEARETGFESLCLVHGTACKFWPAFSKFWDREQNFFVALSEFSGKKIFVMDNAHAEFIEACFGHPEIEVLQGRYIRDGRAITASYARKMAHTGLSYIESIQPEGWFYPSFQSVPSLNDLQRNGDLVVRYEDAVKDQKKFLETTGKFLGITYYDDTYRFWEKEHHITVGNQGPIAMVQMHQGLKVANFESKKVYQEQLDTLKVNPLEAFSDERWRTQLTSEDRNEFDFLLGKKNAELGYTRDIKMITGNSHGGYWELSRTLRILRQGFKGKIYRPIFQKLKRQFPQKARQLTSSEPVRYVARLDPKTTNSAYNNIFKLSDEQKTAHIDEIFIPSQNADGIRRLIPPIDDGIAKRLESTTQYFDGIRLSDYKKLRPYKVVRSEYTRKQLEELVVSRNMYLGYGPDSINKPATALSVDPLARYRDFLEGMLCCQNLVTQTFWEGFSQLPAAGKSTLLIRQDVDGDLVAALDMAKLENRLGFRSSYYFLHTAPYHSITTNGITARNEAALEIYLEIQSLGHEVAIHTDPLYLYQTHEVDGCQGLTVELDRMREAGLSVRGSLAHNSFDVYGANNYSVFKGRPLSTFYSCGSAKAVVRNNKWAPLQFLDESELGLDYEGNEIFWQREIGVRYYCLMQQGLWNRTKNLYGTLLEPSSRPKQESDFISQEDMLLEAAHIPHGQYVVVVVHPLHYGQRIGPTQPPHSAICGSYGKDVEEERWLGGLVKKSSRVGGKTKVEVSLLEHPNNEGSPTRLERGLIGERVEYTSISCPDSKGSTDKPLSLLADGQKRILFVGCQNFASTSIASDSKLSQMTVTLLKKQVAPSKLANTDLRAATISGDTRAAQLKYYLDACQPDQLPDLMIIGVNGKIDVEVKLAALVDSIPIRKIFLCEYANIPPATYQSGVGNAEFLSEYEEWLNDQENWVDPFLELHRYVFESGCSVCWQSKNEWNHQGHFISAKLLAEKIFIGGYL